MNKKGFTLVELLAVVIILALLALLTSTAITKLVKDSKEDLYNTQIALIKSAAESWGADNLLDLPDSGECSYITLADLKGYGLIDSNITDPRNNEPFSNDLKIKITTTLSSYGKSVTNFEVNPESISGCIGVYAPICTVSDLDNSKTINLSDIITCGTESFYVISNNGTNITALTEKNITLDLTNPVQSTSAETTIFYNSDFDKYYWKLNETKYNPNSLNEYYVYDENSNLYKYIEAYETYLKEKLQVEGVSATLISYEQLVGLGCSGSTDVCSPTTPSWVYSTSYWGGTWSNTYGGIMSVNLNSGGTEAPPAEVTYIFGIRPLITLSLSNIE